jgi:Ca2+-binding RTX toxin-like protein
MAENSSTTPATAGNTSITGTTANDSLSGGGGNDTLIGGDGADRLSGDGPLLGQWQYSVYTRDFSNQPNQTGTIATGTLVGNGYVDDFNVRTLRNTLAGTPGADPNDYGIIYRSTLAITQTGTYTFTTRSDDGSRIIIRNSAGTEVFNLNNDFHQAPRTETGSVTLTAGQTYTIEILYWENVGGDELSATIAGPGITGTTDLATSPLIQTPPLAPGHVDGNDRLDGGAGADTLIGGGGNDQLFGGTGVDSLDGGDGDDLLDGDDNGDIINAGSGNNTVFGGGGAESITSGTGADLIYGGEGSDTIIYGSGDDTVYGGAGDDIIDDVSGSQLSGTNIVYGDEGNDQIWTGNQNDSLYGGADNDTMSGESGDDYFEGGTGVDVMSGGNDSDTFFYQDGDAAFGESIFGGDGGVVDNDTLDLRSYGFSRLIITLNPANGENGTVRFFNAAGQEVGTLTFTDIERIIPCFTAGTLVDTPTGPRPVQDIRPGDLVLTRDDGPQPVRWVGQRSLSLVELLADPSLQPVVFAPGSLGVGLPAAALSVSPQHRMLFSGAGCELNFGEDEVLVPAIHLTHLPGVSRSLKDVTYVHLMFAGHQILCSEGVWSESFQPGDRTLAGALPAQREELFRLFPDLASGAAYPAARLTLKAHEARVLLRA